jgi:hypothetical protein
MAIPVTAAAIISAAVFTASPALADPVDSPPGSVAITVPFSYLHTLGSAQVQLKVLRPATKKVNSAAKTVTFTFPVTGGNANANAFAGAVNLGGTLVVSSGTNTGHQVHLTNLQLSLDGFDIEGTPAGSSQAVSLLDLQDANVTVGSPNPDGSIPEGFTTSDLTIDSLDAAGAGMTGADYLDSALNTQAFQPGDDTGGSLAATWTRTGV